MLAESSLEIINLTGLVELLEPVEDLCVDLQELAFLLLDKVFFASNQQHRVLLKQLWNLT
jgi:hypothetical protein